MFKVISKCLCIYILGLFHYLQKLNKNLKMPDNISIMIIRLVNISLIISLILRRTATNTRLITISLILSRIRLISLIISIFISLVLLIFLDRKKNYSPNDRCYYQSNHHIQYLIHENRRIRRRITYSTT